MARKVKLDILEGSIEEKPEDRPAGAELSLLPAAPSDDSQPSQGRRYKRWIMPGVIVLGVGLIVAGAVLVWMMTGRNNVALTPVKQNPIAAMDIMRRNLVNFDNFVIEYREQGGGFRIVMFAFTAELNGPVNGEAIEDQVALRGAIYTLSKKKTVASLFFPEDRGTFRKEIAAELEKRLGPGTVRAVYFTKFCVL